MSDAKIIDGKAFAQNVRARVAKQVQDLKDYNNVTPGLAVVLVGEDPASQVYVRNKVKQTEECGMKSLEYRRDPDISEQELLTLVYGLNENPEVNGILVQLPLPDHISEDKVIAAIAPEKDVDGFHVINTGLLATGSEDAMVPCTPLGCLMMLKDFYGGDLTGKRAVVVGRSNIVGKPMGALLLNESCTVTTVHSRTQDIEEECRRADILVAAVGRPEMIKKEWIKPGAAVIDVGINRIEKEDGKTKLVGDVAFDEVKEVCGAITPVPGGVGPMTIACLLANTVTAACRQHKIEEPKVD
ncbi:Bifunctional protein FolD 1 (Includes: Methylenetetrahydrofolate dehydrogenase; Methenyltetrahydrofolate cyclohydrolase) [Candidatus Terasakiella magnetica]|uniref:Bifunctional protein FolD n=1 Tax=Candidatus Terasakiella magnetica TaxID=1867952 RepID=A0A1C3RLJ4_9PROT|nr:bifunctional methylenetetrahydrofolate dehydrogenase/methenyltetrahydrofolate cyclohydrolase FolD [Candidatus Terasakiella magnetica]SCA58172.1 Bifunctional protein FolD 1 (Includes: Methylenetetrahydrofolate dehydrogenase; Methenyltetrahydrofolate cyclohydrolase) [Candidatus Terasakiella magnetica]